MTDSLRVARITQIEASVRSWRRIVLLPVALAIGSLVVAASARWSSSELRIAARGGNGGAAILRLDGLTFLDESGTPVLTATVIVQGDPPTRSSSDGLKSGVSIVLRRHG